MPHAKKKKKLLNISPQSPSRYFWTTLEDYIKHTLNSNEYLTDFMSWWAIL